MGPWSVGPWSGGPAETPRPGPRGLRPDAPIDVDRDATEFVTRRNTETRTEGIATLDLLSGLLPVLTWPPPKHRDPDRGDCDREPNAPKIHRRGDTPSPPCRNTETRTEGIATDVERGAPTGSGDGPAETPRPGPRGLRLTGHRARARIKANLENWPKHRDPDRGDCDGSRDGRWSRGWNERSRPKHRDPDRGDCDRHGPIPGRLLGVEGVAETPRPGPRGLRRKNRHPAGPRGPGGPPGRNTETRTEGIAT